MPVAVETAFRDAGMTGTAVLRARAAPRKPQAQRIREWAERAYRKRNAYGAKTAAKITEALARAEKDVKAALLHYSTLGDLPEGKVASQRSLRRLQGEIRAIVAHVRDEHRLILGRASTESFKRGIGHGIEEFVEAQLPFYRDLDEAGIDKMTTNVFTVVDTSALDFMTRFNIQLAGDVSRDLASGINRTIQAGIATGMSVRDIAREMGTVVIDKEAFRHAGKRVFGKAQTRMELIARTETMRAHSQGQRKFYSTVGVRKLEWMTMDDERMCAECEPLDGKVYPIDKFPGQPKHPNCRCGHTAVVDLPICGAGALAAHAAAAQPSCILSPDDVDAQAKEVKADVAVVNEALKTGNFETLTVKQLQTAAKKQGISIARTKADFLKLLDEAEPGVDHLGLTGKNLKAKVAQYKIGALRSKQDLIDLLTAKYAATAQQQAVEAVTPAGKGYEQFKFKELQDMAKGKGIPISMTKADVIELLDEIEPGVDHSGLKGTQLAAAKQKHGITPLKDKAQLVKALNKSAGHEAAQQAVHVQQAAKVAQAKETLAAKTAAVQVPEKPEDSASFLAAVKAAEDQIAASGIVPQAEVAAHAKEVTLKKEIFQKMVGGMSAGEVKKVAQKAGVTHYQWANKGELTTLLTETDPAKVQAASDSIEAKWAKWAEKHGGKKPAKQKAKPKPAAPAPAPVAPPQPAPPKPVVYSKKGAQFEEADKAWEAKPRGFRLVGRAEIEGAHTKYFYEDETGERWLFKPASEEFRVHGDEVGYRIGRLIDPEAIEVRVITLDGRVGSIQRWRTDVASNKDFAGVDPGDLSPRDIEQLQREHVIDWLISNHDGHGKQFIRTRSGRVYGIDKGQLFKFLGDDELSVDYHPNSGHGESEPYYNTVFRAVQQGRVRVDPSVTLRHIREVERVSDDEYLELLRPYADRRFGRSKAKKEAFYRAALERKRSIRRDFEGFYARALGQPGFRFEEEEPKPASRVGKAEAGLLEDSRRAGWQGKVVPFDIEDVEDQNALVFVETAGGKPRTVVRMKIRPEAEPKLLKSLAVTSGEKLTVDVGDTLPDDTFYDTILGGVKTVNHHVTEGDYAYNQEKLESVRKLRAKLRKLQKSSDPDVAAMAEGYLAECEKVLEGASANKKYTGKFTQYRKQFQSKPDRAEPAKGITARKTKVRMPLRELRKGRLHVVQEHASTGEVFGRSMKDGVQYEIDLGDGITATYKPWVGQNYYAQQGEFELHFDGDPDPKRFEQVMERLDRMGITATIATPEDAELLYLQKQAYVLKVDTSAEYKKAVRELDRKGASKEERIARLRSYWERRLGVDDITRMPGYDPMGEHQAQWDDPSRRAGYRHQMRFDISDEDLERDLPGHALYHRLTDDSGMAGFLDEMLGNNGAMASTIEKMRIGVKTGGMSPESDMDTGGAAYFFTRIRKLPGQRGGSSSPGLYFKKRMLRRMDAITYSGDRFGRVTAQTVRKNRKSTVKEWRQIASRGGSDETIFKYSVTLLDNIDVIAVGSEAQRRQVIQAFKKHGITRLPDGRRVQDIVVVP